MFGKTKNHPRHSREGGNPGDMQKVKLNDVPLAKIEDECQKNYVGADRDQPLR